MYTVQTLLKLYTENGTLLSKDFSSLIHQISGFFFHFFIRYFLHLHFKCCPENPLYLPAAPPPVYTEFLMKSLSSFQKNTAGLCNALWSLLKLLFKGIFSKSSQVDLSNHCCSRYRGQSFEWKEGHTEFIPKCIK
jgi:hypothetical protein